jgi:alpha-acetolactate decarboxylase
MRTRRTLRQLAFIVALALPGCAGEQAEPELTPASRLLVAPRATLTTYGSLSDLMTQGKTSPAVWLRKMGDDSTLVGIGALSGLRGEVAVVDGAVWLGYSTDRTSSHGRTLSGADETAAFLAVAAVPEWQSFTLATGVGHTDLDRRLEKLARDAGLDARVPVPVIIAGRFENLRFHVADGRGMQQNQPISEKDVLASSSQGSHENVKGVLVGFFSTGTHPAIFHPRTRHHLHLVVREKPEVGHVDRVDLAVGTTVRMPVPSR